jgi:hypothetical protein
LDGNDNYPVILHAAYNILQRRESEQTFVQGGGDGMAFTNVGSGNMRNIEQMTCYNCGQNGQYANSCPNPQQPQGQNGVSALTNGTNGFLFSQAPKSFYIPDT